MSVLLPLRFIRHWRSGMAELLPRNIRASFFMLGSLLFLMGCASHPRYGSSPRKKKGCDCPKWNAVPSNNQNEYRVHQAAQNPDLAIFTDATSY